MSDGGICKEVTIYAGSLLADPTVAHAEFTQFFASSITKLAVNTNMVRFLIPMLVSNRLSLENIVDLTLYAQGFPFGAESSLIPFFSHLPNVEALRIFEHPPHRWNEHPIVPETLLPKLKKFSGRPEHSGLVLSDEKRPIEWLEIEGANNLYMETIPGHLELRTLFLSKVLWEEDCVKNLGARFPTLESVTLYADEDDTNYVVHVCISVALRSPISCFCLVPQRHGTIAPRPGLIAPM